MTNRRLTAFRTDNVRNNGCSTVFTCISYEYQILSAKPFIVCVIFHIQLNDTRTAVSRLGSIESTQRLTRVHRRGPTGGTRFIFTPLIHPIGCSPSRCPSRCPHRCSFPHQCHLCCGAATPLTSSDPLPPHLHISPQPL